MIDGLKPYPKYKDSALSWLETIPSHWNEKRAKYLFHEVDERSKTGKEELLSVSHITGVTPRSQKSVTMFMAESTVGYKISRPGDLVINTMWAWMGALGVSSLVGLVSPAYGVYRPSQNSPLSFQFIDHLLRSPQYISEYICRSTGIQSSRLRLYPEQFLRISIVCPTPNEQCLILRFVAHVDRRIRRYIAAKKKLIALLNEQKQAIIHRAVTRGLDPNVRLKPSGVEWLRDVPEHWEIKRLKDVAVVQTGLTLGKSYRNLTTEPRPYLRVANVQHGRVDLRQVKHIDVPPSEATRTTLRSGDVLVTEGGDIDKLGRGCVWRDEIPGCLHQNHVFAVRCQPATLAPEFLVGLMISEHGRAYFQLTAKQTTNLASTNSSTLRAFPILLPSFQEQELILGELANRTTVLNTAAAQVEREITLLREYRTRLIADVVTGKLDVREAAARLPAEADTPEPLDAADAPEDDDGSSGEADPDAPEDADP